MFTISLSLSKPLSFFLISTIILSISSKRLFIPNSSNLLKFFVCKPSIIFISCATLILLLNLPILSLISSADKYPLAVSVEIKYISNVNF